VLFLGEERKKKIHQQQIKQSPPTRAVTPERRHGGASNNTIEGCFQTSGGVAYVASRTRVTPTLQNMHYMRPNFFVFFYIYLVK